MSATMPLAASPIAQHTARVGDVTLAYLTAGSGDPLVLLHGFPQHSHMWRALMPALAEHFTVIAPDLRGMGGSSVGPPRYDKRTLAADVRALVHDALGHRRVRLAGYDHGAGVAYAYAAAHPDEVERVAFCEFVFPGFGYEAFIAPRRGWDENWQLVAFTVPELCDRFIAGRERELLSWYFHVHADQPGAVSAEDFERYVRALQRPGVLRAGFGYNAACWDDADHNREAVARVGKLRMPAAHIGGEKAVGAHGAESARGLAERVESVVIPHAGHWLPDEQPRAFAEALLAFFGNGPNAAPAGGHAGGG